METFTKNNKQDLVRTELMESNGYKILRFNNTEVLEDWQSVERHIETFLK